MPEPDSLPNDQSSRTLARWNEIESLTSGLAIQALQDLARDLEQHMVEVKAMTAAKQKLRELIIKVGQEASHAATEPQRPAALRELDTLADDLKERLDSLNELSEMTSLRLQMMMDQRSKIISTLSNILKKISTTQDAVVRNLK